MIRIKLYKNIFKMHYFKRNTFFTGMRDKGVIGEWRCCEGLLERYKGFERETKVYERVGKDGSIKG